jgi:hypothetical protein
MQCIHLLSNKFICSLDLFFQEEEQLHLNVGLNKIAETVGQVEEMQKSLAVKSAELQAKNDMANAKLKQMVNFYIANGNF